MYTIVWKKYLPVIKILMKKASAGDQQLSLNKTDFEKDKVARKTNVRFSFKMVNAIAQNAAAVPPLGRELTSVLLEDSTVISLLQRNEFTFSMNSRYELGIHLAPKAMPETEAASEAIAAAEAPLLATETAS